MLEAAIVRNKYPEETVRRILDVAEELFMTKGYEHTTMADIVNGLGGLTKGAVYHHFKSKEDIYEAVFERANAPMVEACDKVMRDRSLTGLQKIRALEEASAAGPSAEMWVAMKPDPDPIKNARMLAREYQDLLETAHAYLEPAIREGIEDGSISCELPRETAEVLLLIANLWMVPLYNPVSSPEEFARRVRVFESVSRALGVELTDANAGGLAAIEDAWSPFVDGSEEGGGPHRDVAALSLWATAGLHGRIATAGWWRQPQAGMTIYLRDGRSRGLS